jgi:hypothetical protein
MSHAFSPGSNPIDFPGAHARQPPGCKSRSAFGAEQFFSVSDLPPLWCQDSAPFGKDFRETIEEAADQGGGPAAANHAITVTLAACHSALG